MRRPPSRWKMDKKGMSEESGIWKRENRKRRKIANLWDSITPMTPFISLKQVLMSLFSFICPIVMSSLSFYGSLIPILLCHRGIRQWHVILEREKSFSPKWSTRKTRNRRDDIILSVPEGQSINCMSPSEALRFIRTLRTPATLIRITYARPAFYLHG